MDISVKRRKFYKDHDTQQFAMFGNEHDIVRVSYIFILLGSVKSTFIIG